MFSNSVNQYEFPIGVKAYSEVYGKMTPTQVIKRLIDAGLKRCDPEVYEALIRRTEGGTQEPVLEITYPVDPTEGEVWEMRYFFEKNGEQLEAEWAKSDKASFSVKVNNRSCGVKEMLQKGWVLINEVGIEISEDQALVIAQKRRKHLEDLELQEMSARLESIYSKQDDWSEVLQPYPYSEEKK